MFHVALPPACMGKRREGDDFFRDFASNVSHALFARRGHYGLSVLVGKYQRTHVDTQLSILLLFSRSRLRAVVMRFCGESREVFDFSQSLQEKLCMEPAVLSCGAGSCSKCRMGMMWPFPCEL